MKNILVIVFALLLNEVNAQNTIFPIQANKSDIDALAIPVTTVYEAIATGTPNASASISYPASVTGYQSNFVYNVRFDFYSDGQPLTINLGFGALPLRICTPNDKKYDVLANQIIQEKVYKVVYNAATNEFNLLGETSNIVSVSEAVSGLPNAATPYSVFKQKPFDGQMVEVWFDSDSQGNDSLEVGFGSFPLLYTDQNNLDEPIQSSMIRKASRYVLVWNTRIEGWNVMNHSTLPAPTNISQLNNDSDFINNTTLVTSLSLKQDKTSVAVPSIVAGNATTSQSLRITDQGVANNILVDNLFSVAPTKDATGRIILPTGSSGWGLLGNAATVQATNFLGTTDNIGLSFRTNNTIRQTITNTGNVGINSTVPNSTLDVAGSLGTSNTNATTATVTLGANDHTVVLTLAGSQTVTYPAVSSSTRREYIIVNPTSTAKAFAAVVTGMDGVTTTAIPANSSTTIKCDGTIWRVIQQSLSSAIVSSATTTTTGTINGTNATYMQLTGLAAGTYDVHYKITLSNSDPNNKLWATGITVNNAAQTFPTGADGTATILGALAANHPFTVTGYRRVTVTAGQSLEVKGQIYGTIVTAPLFVGNNILTATKVN